MSPSGLISFTIIMLPIILLVAVALFWKKARVVLLLLATIVASGTVYYLLYQEEASVQEWYVNEEIVEQYLKERYPEDEWVLMKEVGSSLLNPKDSVQVVFLDEPKAIYSYFIEDGEVSLAGWSGKEGYNAEGKRD